MESLILNHEIYLEYNYEIKFTLSNDSMLFCPFNCSENG